MSEHLFLGIPKICGHCGEHEEGMLPGDEVCPGKPPVKVQLVVTMLDGSLRFYPIGFEAGWKIDASSRCLIIGKGFGRVYVPLDNVESFSPVTY